MARGRFVSKAISLDENVDSLSNDTVRLLFTWLITHLDCEGRMYGDPQTVKSIVFPRRSMKAQTIEKYLLELEHKGLILRYSAPSGFYLCMKNFDKHQPGLNKSREAQSQIPPPSQELIQSNVGVSPSEVKVKEQDKVEVKEETKTKEESCSSLKKEDVSETYERNIGELSEDMESEIELAVKRFTGPWVVDAIREAVKHSRKSWAYIAGILKNWERYGKDVEAPRTDKVNPDKFVQGKYGKSVRR